jgi:transposase
VKQPKGCPWLPQHSLIGSRLISPSGKLGEIDKAQKPLAEVEMELARTKKELKMKRDILKKAAAYFAKESLPGTRR